MFIRFGYDITISCLQETTMASRMAIRDERRADLAQDEVIELSPGARRHEFVDGFGNRCLRIVAPPGDLRLRGDRLIRDDGFPDPVDPGPVLYALTSRMFPVIARFTVDLREARTSGPDPNPST